MPHRGLAVRQGEQELENKDKPRLVIPGSESQKLFELLTQEEELDVRVKFHQHCEPDDLYYLIGYEDRSAIRFDDLSRRRITAVLGNKDRSRLDPYLTYSFKIRDGFNTFGSKQSFWQRVGPRLEVIEVL